MHSNTDISNFIVGGNDTSDNKKDKCIESCINKAVKKSLVVMFIVIIIINLISIIFYTAASNYINKFYNNKNDKFKPNIGGSIKNYFGTRKSNMITSENSVYDKNPLRDCGWEVYVLDSCPYCVKQKSILTEHFPNFRDIYKNNDPNIPAVPAWKNKNTDELRLGLQSYEELQKMIAC